MSDGIETYVLLAKQATGKALESLIQKVIESPSIFSFTALLETPSIQGLQNTDYANSLALLQIYSYGTLQDYTSHTQTLPPISETARHKLKQLSLVSLANDSHHIPYDRLKEALEIRETRELEDLIISATYAGLVSAKLNTRLSQVYIESSVGRDLHPEASLDTILSSLEAWQGTCDAVLAQVSGEMDRLREDGRRRLQESSEHRMAIAMAKSQVRGTNGAGKRRDINQYDELMSDMNEDEEMSGVLTPRASHSFIDPIRQAGRKRKTPMPRQ